MKVLLFAICIICFHTNNASELRKEKLLSIFSIVNFPNDQCVSSSATGLRGQCLTTEECAASSGGSALGNCAAGFGVCCVFVVNSSGTDVTTNSTYLQNSGFPSALTSTAALTVTHSLSRFDPEICQVRLDFVTGVFAAPDANGACTTDTVTITQATGGTIPTLCGTITGQHMYLETAGTSALGSIVFGIAATAATRMWNVRVTAIPCNSPSAAPRDCLQFYTGSSGNIQSYNLAGNRHLQDQQYRVCIREEFGYCQISYRESSTASPDPFLLEGGAAIAAATAICTSSHVSFQVPTNVATTICGGIFCNIDAGTIPCEVTTGETPFGFNVFAVAAAMTAATGFSLDYSQIPCGNNGNNS